jgi:hypothetical protein
MIAVSNGQGEPNVSEDGTSFALQGDAHNYVAWDDRNQQADTDTYHTLRGAGLQRSDFVAATLSAGGHPDSNMPGRHHEDDENLIVGSTIDEGAARPLVARASGYRMDMESETFVVANSLRAGDGHHGWSGARGDGGDNLLPFGFDKDASGDAAKSSLKIVEDGVPSLISVRAHAVCQAGMGVRRLTPLECERLQGWPDDWVRFTADGKQIPDSHQYRMIGNGVVAPVAEFIGHRLMAVDQA